MEHSESIKELAAALSRAQSTLQTAKKGSENPFFHSRYADLLSIWEACRETLTANGLSISQLGDVDTDGRAVLETVLMHESGEWIKGRLPLMSIKADPQAQGSAITYARRYSLSAIIGLCTEEDDDGEASMDRTAKGQRAEEGAPICAEHGVPFKKFEKEGRSWWSHKTDEGWCNLKAKSKIDMDWLKDALDELAWADVGKWLKGKYPEAKGQSVKQIVTSLTPEHQEEFVAEVESRLEEH